jgi:hypothetical protein
MKTYIRAAFLICMAILFVGAKSPTKRISFPPYQHSHHVTAQQVIAFEYFSWESYKNRDAAGINRIVADDYVGLFHSGISTKNSDTQTLARLTISSYTIEQPTVQFLGDDVAILRYRNRLIGTYDGVPLAKKPLFATAIYSRRNGIWQLAGYQETEVQ